MKKSMGLILALNILIASQSFATTAVKCADAAVKSAVTQNYRTFDASTESCGVKAVNITNDYESFLVCSSDETDINEYLVTINIDHSKTGEQACSIASVLTATESATPHFESDEGMLNAVACSIQYGNSKTAIRCQ